MKTYSEKKKEEIGTTVIYKPLKKLNMREGKKTIREGERRSRDNIDTRRKKKEI